MQTRFTSCTGVALPIVQGPFGGGLSTVALASAVSNAGGLGSFGAHHLPPGDIAAVVAALKASTSRPFAINLWVPQPTEPTAIDAASFEAHVARLRPHLDALDVASPSMPERFAQSFDAQVDAALAGAPPVLSFVMGVPPAHVVERARARGIVTIGTASTVDEAITLDRAGLDLVVASGSDAGGHRGAFLRPVSESLVGTFSLVPQVVDAVGCPVIAAGGIADGRGMAAAFALGADAVQIGTAFLACEESAASEAHRLALASPRARSTVLTRAFSGRHARGIPNAFIAAMGPYEDEIPPYPVQNWLTQPMRRAAALRGDAEHLSLWAGQAAPLTTRRTAADLVESLVAQWQATTRS